MKLKKTLALLLAALLLVLSAACSTAPTSTPTPTPEPPPQTDTVEFVDSAGRTVELPAEIARIAPTGPLAQIVLYTLCPEKMAGWAGEFTETQRAYIDARYADLPVFGNFYGDTLSLESVMAAGTQVIIDIGEPKEGIAEDMDAMQERTGIPTVFIEMEMDSMAEAYRVLGALVGAEEQGGRLADYIDQTLAQTDGALADVPEGDRPGVYFAIEDGLTAYIRGSSHAEVIERAGGINVVEVERTERGGAAELSMEQVMLWNPDVILLTAGDAYGRIGDLPEWAGLDAVREGRYYQVPEGPYNWMGRPPSVNRVLGIKWLSSLLHPDLFDYDMVRECQEFYKLFYHCDLSEAQALALLGQSDAGA